MRQRQPVVLSQEELEQHNDGLFKAMLGDIEMEGKSGRKRKLPADPAAPPPMLAMPPRRLWCQCLQIRRSRITGWEGAQRLV